MLNLLIAFVATLIFIFFVARFIVFTIRQDEKDSAQIAELIEWHNNNKANAIEADTKLKNHNNDRNN